MNEAQLKKRTKEFAKLIIRVCRQLPITREGRLAGNQLFRSGTSVGANYRAACRGRSKADFTSKLGIALEEADETLYWLELITECGILRSALTEVAMKESNELVSILVASINTAREE